MNFVSFMPLIAYALVILFACLYAVTSSVEFGAALLTLPKKPFIDHKSMSGYMTPIWEAVNVFLVFTVVGLVMFFPGVVPPLALALYAPASVALVFYGIRVLGIQGVLYSDSKHPIFRVLFALGSVGGPIVLSLVYYYLITGLDPLSPTLGEVAIIGIVVSAIYAISSSFFLYFIPKNTERVRLAHVAVAAELCFAAFSVVFLGLVAQYLSSVTGVLVLTALIAVYALGFVALVHHAKYVWALALAALNVIVLIAGVAIMHAPYILYRSLDIYSTFTSVEVFTDVLIALPFGLLAIVPAIFLLFKMYAVKKN